MQKKMGFKPVSGGTRVSVTNAKPRNGGPGSAQTTRKR